MTVESALQTLHWLHEIYVEAQETINRLSGGRRGIPRSLANTMSEKEYNSLINEYTEAVAAKTKSREAYLAIRAFYAFPEAMDKAVRQKEK